MQTLKPKIFKDRLTTTDESGHRIRVIPAEVKGRFQRAKTKVHFFLVAFFLALPWLKIGGYPAFQLDVPHRRFFLAGHLFLPQDVPGIFFIIAAFTITLIFLSAVFGRAWCGWACPQTVFIEGFFRRVERWIEGNHLKQRELDKSPWNAQKIFKKSFKWLMFLLGSLVVTHSFLGIFVGGSNVLHMMVRAPSENPGSFAVVMVSTGIILFNFGWFREQFCLIACPYGRFQSVMMDRNSVTIAYDAKRGEPRKGSVPEGATQGDCINCRKCIHVCPTGIDIRNGFQMECIACTACADVCDEVMVKIGKPTGLVRYASEVELEGKSTKLLRPRVFVYGFLFLLMVGGAVYRVSTQETYQTEILRAIDTPYQLIKGDGGVDYVINHFKVNWYNLSPESAHVEIRLPDELKSQGFELVQSTKDFAVESGRSVHHQIFVKFPREVLNNSPQRAALHQIQLFSVWQTVKGEEVIPAELKIVGPESAL